MMPMSTANQPAAIDIPCRSGHPGRWWRVSGIVLVLLAIVFSTPIQSQQNDPDHVDWETLLFFAPLTFVSMIGGLYCFMRGKRMKALSAQELTHLDKRPPVVYLRSFRDDAAGASNPFAGILGLASFVFGMSSEEEQLAEAFNGVGPFIAIGKPGETLPQTGAARMYVSDSEWHERVEQLMQSSQLVALRIGKTPGFWWEVQRAVEIADPTKIVFLVPFGKKPYQEFCRRAVTILPCHLPPLPGGQSFSLGPLRAMIYFGPDWTPRIVRLKARWSVSLNPLGPILRNALLPVARQLHLDLSASPAPKRSWFSRSLATIPGLLTMLVVWSLVGGVVIQSLAATLSNLARRNSERGDLEGAARHQRQAIHLSPEAAEPHNNLGVTLYQQHNLDGAIAEYREATRLKPALAVAHSNLCLALHDKGSVDEAIVECREAIRLDPRNGQVHNTLGVALYEKHDWDGAIAEYREALRLDPRIAPSHYNLCVALYDKGSIDDAIVECRQATRLDPRNAVAHTYLGLGLAQKGDPAAIDEFQTASDLAPDDKNIRKESRLRAKTTAGPQLVPRRRLSKPEPRRQ